MTAKKFFLSTFFIFIFSGEALALSNSADAFMSLPFGHNYERTQKRMTNSGAKVITPRKESLTMEGMFEGYPATFVFGFYKNKILKSKAAYLQSMGDAEKDSKFYMNLQKSFNRAFGSGHETPNLNRRNSKKLIMQNVWTPDRYSTITLTYNPDASKKFPGTSLSQRFIQIIYKSDKWDK